MEEKDCAKGRVKGNRRCPFHVATGEVMKSGKTFELLQDVLVL